MALTHLACPYYETCPDHDFRLAVDPDNADDVHRGTRLLAAHLDDQHPGWTIAALQQLRRQHGQAHLSRYDPTVREL